MDPLESVLRPAIDVLNRNIPEVTRARQLCAELAGTTVAIHVNDTAMAAFFTVNEESISLSRELDDDPELCIRGSLLALGKMAATGDASAIRDGSVELIGDAETAQSFQELLSTARPDLEEGVAKVFGDAAAHSLGELGRSVQRWAEDAGATMGTNIREYVQEESRDAPSRYEAERFASEVTTLRDDVDRLAARISRLAERTD